MIKPLDKTALTKGGWLTELLLLLLGALLFALSFPNFLYSRGFSVVSWFALVPVFLLIHKVRFWKVPIYGFLYGYIAYSIFNFWLAKFNPLSFIVVPLIYAVYFTLWFPVFKLADRGLPRWGYLVQLVFWLAYEIFRTLGFLGYSYGIMGYSQYRNTSFIGIADLTGVLGVSMMVVFPSLWLYRYIRFRKEEGRGFGSLLKARFLFVPACIYLVLLVGSFAYSLASRVDYRDSPRWKVSVIQHDVNAWLSGIEVYSRALDTLLELSGKALEENPDTVIWSETAFVPSIEWHNKRREDRERFALVQRLFEFLESTETSFLIGNNDSIFTAGRRVSYNAVLQFQGTRIVDRYHKIHLVPFGEHFPYEKLFPRFYRYILDSGATFYEKGEEYTVFDMGKGVKASPLICFEDTFGYLSRNFVRQGSQVLVNVSNDSWSPAQACSLQHAGMAVFRSIENRRSMIRATNGGFSCLIDPNGKILEFLEPFTADILTVDVPVYDEGFTVYTRSSFLFDRLVMILSLMGFLLLIIQGIVKFRRYRK